MSWKPIDTAPKDGTRVVLKSPHGVRSGNWWIGSHGMKARWEYDGWESDGCGCCGGDDEPPTHWTEYTEPEA